jgi:hypothetical protein
VRDPRYARRRRAAVPGALAAFMLLVVVSGAHTPLTWAGGSPFTPAMTIVLPAQQVAVAPVEPASEPPGEPLPLNDAPAATAPTDADDGASDGGSRDDDTGSGDDTTTEGPPPIRHVFVVMLRQTDLVALAGDAAADPPTADPAPVHPAHATTTPAPTIDPVPPSTYFADTLVPQGTLLTHYAAVARGSLANGIALLSGQGPTAQTLADCPTAAGAAPADVAPDVLGDDGQQLGDGCVYPFATGTAVDQLTGAGLDWRAYLGDAGDGACPATPRNPFAYFHSLLDTDACARHVGGLDALDGDLAKGADAPALLYVVPGACHDGSATPCADGAPAGPADADAFLRDVVERILASPAYADGGLIAITSDGPPSPPQPTAPAPPAATTPIPAPPPPTTPTVPTTPTPPPTTPTVPTIPTPPPGQTTPTVTMPGPLATVSADPADPAAAPFPPTYPNVGDAPAAGAARVGALLISPAVRAGVSSDVAANHFTLLRTISDLLALQPLGYAGAAGLEPLPEQLLAPNER